MNSVLEERVDIRFKGVVAMEAITHLFYRPGDAEDSVHRRVNCIARSNRGQVRPNMNWQLFFGEIDSLTRGDGVWDVRVLAWDEIGTYLGALEGSFNPREGAGSLHTPWKI